MRLRMRICALLFTLAAFGCGRDDCLPARSSPPPDCPSGTFADASVNDPICVSSTGLPICRDPMNACLMCTGADFTDGCRIAGTDNECVHQCAAC